VDDPVSPILPAQFYASWPISSGGPYLIASADDAEDYRKGNWGAGARKHRRDT